MTIYNTRRSIAAHYLGFLVALAVSVGIGIYSGNAHAGTLDLDVNVASLHTEAWARDQLNQSNPGLGLSYHWNRTWSVMGGEYLNSYRRPTWYALGAWTPLHLGSATSWHLDAGLAAGVATGYRTVEVPSQPAVAAAVLRVSAPDGVAVNLLAVPNQGARNTGFVGLQISFPLMTR